jgi:MoaA/NifB/PqqE/SkfB family radical SAM enzyme
MLCGGEPLTVAHFFDVARILGDAGVNLKIETNGQRFDAAAAAKLAGLPIRSIQISRDGDTQETYARQRPGGSLARVHAACAAVRDAGFPLEVTFAPTRINIHEAEAVIERARSLGAFRFNTGKLMRLGTAARHWARVAPDAAQYTTFRQILERLRPVVEPQLELCYVPWSIEEALAGAVRQPPATLLVLPNGWVKVAAALPLICADLRTSTVDDAWASYRRAWRDEATAAAAKRALDDESSHAQANTWRLLPVAHV